MITHVRAHVSYVNRSANRVRALSFQAVLVSLGRHGEKRAQGWLLQVCLLFFAIYFVTFSNLTHVVHCKLLEIGHHCV